jgi:hypothetical protein
MKITQKSKSERLEFFRSLYEGARYAYAEARERLERHLKQYRGSDEIDGGERALTVRNVTYEIIESQVSSEIPAPKTDASYYTEERERLAHSIEALLRSLRSSLPFDEQNDLDERYTYIFGGSVRYVEWDSTLRCGAQRGGVRIHCINPMDLTPQPNVWSIDDMEYCFLRFCSTRGEIKERYGISDEECYRLELEGENGEVDTGDTVSMIITFWRNEEGEVSQFIFSGDVVLLDTEAYYRRKSIRDDDGVCDVMHEIVRDRYSSGRFIKVPYYVPREFPIVIRKNTSLDGSLLGQSDCEYLRPEQQAINKLESRILQKLLRSGVTPIVPEDASITVNNSVFGQVIRMKPGESMAQYGKVDTTPDVSQDIAEAERLYDHAKRILGITDAYQGIDGRAGESGYAKQLKISQSGGRLESKRRMKNAAYARLDRLIFLHYLAFADEVRDLSYKDQLGRVHNERFNKYDFIVCADDGTPVYDDSYLFSTDPDGGTEYQREALWQRNLENLRAGTLGDPTAPETLLRYWQAQQRAHYPHANDNVEYFKQVICRGASATDAEIAARVPTTKEILQTEVTE